MGSVSTGIRYDGLASRVESARAKAAVPAYGGAVAPSAVDVEAWAHVGDPIGDALVGELRARKLMGGDILVNARRLEAEGVGVAVDFFADVETVPTWADFDAMRLGADMGRRNPVGMVLGIHGSLPYTYLDPATARVMNSTGRLGRSGDFGRRYWETATGFIGALDVDGMRPGGARWEQWVRIRLLHTQIRLGIRRSGRWDDTLGEPIGQLPMAISAHIFGPYRVAIMRSFGALVTREEETSFNLMWRWICRIEGANAELLGRTDDEQRRISVRLQDHLYGPGRESAELTAAMLDGLATMRDFQLVPRRIHTAIVRRVMSADVLDAYAGHDVVGDLDLPQDRLAALTISSVATVLKMLNQALRVPAARRAATTYGGRLIDASLSRGLGHRPADYRASRVRGDMADSSAAPRNTGTTA
jgi:hypothetical protein